MKRIMALLKGKLDDVKLNNKVKRVENALAVAVTNAESDKIAQDDRLAACVQELTDNDVNVNDVLKEMMDCIEQKHAIDDALVYAEELKKFLLEEVSVPKKEKEE